MKRPQQPIRINTATADGVRWLFVPSCKRELNGTKSHGTECKPQEMILSLFKHFYHAKFLKDSKLKNKISFRFFYFYRELFNIL